MANRRSGVADLAAPATQKLADLAQPHPPLQQRLDERLVLSTPRPSLAPMVHVDQTGMG